MSKSTPVAYVFFNSEFDWECLVSETMLEGINMEDISDGWYLAGQVSSLKELFQLMEKHDFDAEYFYEYVEHCMSHRLYNLLNKEDAYYGY